MLFIRRATMVRNTCRLAAFSIVAMALATSSARGAVLADNFNDGNDTGWMRYDPLVGFGAGGAWSFPNGAYRIQTPTPSPDPGALGPPRAGSVIESDVYEDFFVSVDVVDWDETLDQAFGILARVNTPGLGTTSGYAFSYSTHADSGNSSMDLSRVTGEAAANIVPAFGLVLEPGRTYRFEFEGRGATLEGRVYDLADLVNPMLVATAEDGVYDSGSNGLFVFDNSDGTGTADATFDNFTTVPEPGSAAVLLAAMGLALARRRR
jgi:hypothetical protein